MPITCGSGSFKKHFMLPFLWKIRSLLQPMNTPSILHILLLGLLLDHNSQEIRGQEEFKERASFSPCSTVFLLCFLKQWSFHVTPSDFLPLFLFAIAILMKLKQGFKKVVFFPIFKLGNTWSTQNCSDNIITDTHVPLLSLWNEILQQ